MSSLLHSSTMVVARVFLLSFLGVYSPFFGFLSMSYRIYMGLIRYFFKDYKRVVAYSTSSQLVLIRLFFVLRAFVWTIFYVYVHAFFKASLFIMCGMFIHIVDIQQYGVSSSGLVYTFFVFCLISILGFPFLSVIKLKDEIVLSNVGLIQVSFVFFGVSTFLYCVKMVFCFDFTSIKMFFGGFLFFVVFFVFFAVFCDFLLASLCGLSSSEAIYGLFFVGFFFSLFFVPFVMDVFYKFFGFLSFSLSEIEVKVF